MLTGKKKTDRSKGTGMIEIAIDTGSFLVFMSLSCVFWEGHVLCVIASLYSHKRI